MPWLAFLTLICSQKEEAEDLTGALQAVETTRARPLPAHCAAETGVAPVTEPRICSSL